MTLPDVRVLMNFTLPPSGAVPGTGWIDVSDDVKAFNIGRGRSYEFDRFETGVCDVLLDNTSGDYDPTNTSSPYYPNVLPMRRLKIATGYRLAVLQDEPVAYWRLGDIDPDVIRDEMGFSSGSLAGSTYTLSASGALSGSSNASIALSGTSDLLTVPHTAHLNLGNEFTIEAWVKPTAGGTRVIVSKTTGAGASQCYRFLLNSSGKLQLRSDGTVVATSSTSVSSNVWTHVAVAKSGTASGACTFYLNGAADTTSANNAYTFVDGTDTLRIGSRNGSGADNFTGFLDEIAVYNRALPASAIAAHYLEGTTGIYDADLFYGYIEGWPQDFNSDHEADMTITASDAFALFANADLPSAYDIEVLMDSPKGFYRLDETAGTQCVDSSGNGNHGTYTGGATEFSAEPLIPDGGKSIDFPAVGLDGPGIDLPDSVRLAPNVSVSGTAMSYSGQEITIEFWYQGIELPSDYGSGARVPIFTQHTPDRYGPSYAALDFYDVSLNSAGQVSWFTGGNSVGAGITALSDYVAAVPIFGRPYTWHIVCVLKNDGGTPEAEIWMNASNRPVTASGAAGSEFIRRTVIARAGRDSAAYGYVKGRLDNVALYETALTSADIERHFNAGLTPWTGDTVDERLTRILDHLEWPTSGRRFDVGVSELGPALIAGKKALDYFQTLTDSESGHLYMAADGTLVFRSRHALLTDDRSRESQATFGDANGEYEYAALEFDSGEQLIRNSVRVTDADGNPITVEDPESISKFLKRSYSRELAVVDIDEARDAANWTLSKYKDPLLRVKSMVLEPVAGNTALFTQCLNRDIGDRVTVKRQTPSGNTITQEVLLEGVSHSYDARSNRWRTKLNLSPAESRSYIVLDDPSLGLLDGVNRMAH